MITCFYFPQEEVNSMLIYVVYDATVFHVTIYYTDRSINWDISTIFIFLALYTTTMDLK